MSHDRWTITQALSGELTARDIDHHLGDLYHWVGYQDDSRWRDGLSIIEFLRLMDDYLKDKGIDYEYPASGY